MSQGTLTIYNASAGSGKTYMLTENYLTSLFRSRYNYRKILAVTFTNKATAEMKSRILDHLHKIGTGEYSGYLEALTGSTGKSPEWIKNESNEILNAILHDYSRFSVSTIDSFFQRVLRSFTKEAGLHAGFNIELDHSIILSSAIDDMISSAKDDDQLKKWLITYAKSNIDEEKSWNLKANIVALAEELFKEKFKILSSDERSKLADKEFLFEYIGRVKSVTKEFEKDMTAFGKEACDIYAAANLSDDMFYRKSQGVPGFIRSLASDIINPPGKWVREIMDDPPKWSTGAQAPQLLHALQSGLNRVLQTAIHYFDDNLVRYRSAQSILRNIFALGILSDVLYNVHLISSSENSFLLSDAGELLYLITAHDQTPFIYEKIGNRYENFMIDEFQDTSIMQWNNFNPLIDNSMSEGFDNLVVGDVKQSIYRWRNSDWRILGLALAGMVDNERILSHPLTTNWRSRSNIIRFNNALFTVIPELIDKSLEEEKLPVSFRKLYSEAVQTDPCKNEGGYIRLEFIENSDNQKWKDEVLERIPLIIKSLQAKGHKASDIGIIVRDCREGAMILGKLIDYSGGISGTEAGSYNFSAVSDDSLLLSASPVIIFIIAVLSLVNDPLDSISKAVMLRFFLMSTGNENADTVSLLSDKLEELSGLYFPEGYRELLDRIKQLPLFEATESIIRFFRLGEYASNIPFLNTFQDYLVSFTTNKNAGIQTFLEWWEESGTKKSVVLPGNQDAIRILTIHKSKGLEFKVVIVPFISWPLDHISSKQTVLWVKPEMAPFSDLGIVPVRYGKDLAGTIFADYYREEKYSAYLDNINLLYVAMTRAKDVLYGFSVDNPRLAGTVAGVLKSAVTTVAGNTEGMPLVLNNYYNSESKIFEYGGIDENVVVAKAAAGTFSSRYVVSQSVESLRLKLHGENYFSSEKTAIRKKINYGKMMHEVFEGINTSEDIASSVRKLVLEGKLAIEEAEEIEVKVHELIEDPRVAEWFDRKNKVLNEAGILLPSGNTRRPDRVILKDGKTIVIDFKFGEENPRYSDQVEQYRKLLNDMGYLNIEAFVWYVDKNKIVTV